MVFKELMRESNAGLSGSFDIHTRFPVHGADAPLVRGQIDKFVEDSDEECQLFPQVE
jgi:hypothetical protein